MRFKNVISFLNILAFFSFLTENNLNSTVNNDFKLVVNASLKPKKKVTDPDEYVIDSQSEFGVTITTNSVFGSQQSIIADIPESEHFTVTSKQIYQQIKIINGQVEQEENLVLKFIPQSEGSFSIGPITVKRGNVEKKFPPFKVTTVDNKKNHPVIAEINLEKGNTLFVWEPSTLIVKIYFLNNLARNLSISEFNIPDFDVKKIDEKRSSEIIDNTRYEIFEIHYSITPLKTGEFDIPAIQIDFEKSSGNGSQRSNFVSPGDEAMNFFMNLASLSWTAASIRSNRIKTTVLELPQTNQPVDGIGNFFKLTGQVLGNGLFMLHEPIIYSLTIEGDSCLSAKAPKLKMPRGVKYYFSKEEVVNSNKQKSDKKIFEYILQSEFAGKIVLPKQQFYFFNTTNREYETLFSEELQIEVVGSNVEENQKENVEPIVIKEKGQSKVPSDNLDYQYLSAVSIFASKNQIPSTIFWLLIILIFVLIIILKTKELIQGYYRKQSSLKFAMSQLRKIVATENYQKMYDVILEYFVINIDAKFDEITFDLVHDLLMKKISLLVEKNPLLKDDLLENSQAFFTILILCQEIKFGRKKLSFAERQDLLDKVKTQMYWLDKIFKNK